MGCAALLSAMGALSLPAQAMRPDLVGSRVRVTLLAPEPGTESRIVVGNLVAVGDSALSIRPLGTTAEERVATSRVQRFEVRAGRNRAAGGRLGALIGLGSGLMLGYALGDDCTSQDWICFDRDETTAGGAVLGAALGAGIGLLVGRGDRWREAPVPGAVSLMPVRGGVRLAVSLRL
jgi:hypothetical protein